MRATPQPEIGETNDHNDTTSQEQQWRTDIRQALAETATLRLWPASAETSTYGWSPH